MQVSIRTLVNLTRNATLQRTVAHVLAGQMDDDSRAMTQADIDAIGAEFDRRAAWIASATLAELDPFTRTLELFGEEDAGRVTTLRHDMQGEQYNAVVLFKDLARTLGLEQPTQWQDL